LSLKRGRIGAASVYCKPLILNVGDASSPSRTLYLLSQTSPTHPSQSLAQPGEPDIPPLSTRERRMKSLLSYFSILPVPALDTPSPSPPRKDTTPPLAPLSYLCNRKRDDTYVIRTSTLIQALVSF
jgi:hypothetical protein